VGYSYSYYRATDPINILAQDLPPPPVVHEFGPLVAGETRYYDARTGHWVREQPIHIQQYSKDTFPPRPISDHEGSRHY
jgi:hypothetical protein